MSYSILPLNINYYHILQVSNQLLEYAKGVCLSPPCPKKEHKKKY